MNWNGLELPEAYYQDEWVYIIHGDCRSILPLIPDKSVDLVLTSPPFNLGNVHHTDDYRFNPYPDDLPEEEYQAFQIEMLNLLYNKVGDNGSLCYQHKNRFKGGLMISPYEWLLKTWWLIKQEIVWFNGSPNFDKCRFYPMTERLYWLAKSHQTILSNVINKHDDWHIQPEGTERQFKRAFPLELALNIIICFPKANIVVDPFFGSGTTGLACKLQNRKCIGIEIEERYAEIAAKRCSQSVMRLEI